MFGELIAAGLDASFGAEWHKEHTSTGQSIDAAITPTITLMQGQIAALEAAVGALGAQIPTLHLSIANLTSQVSALSSQLANLHAQTNTSQTSFSPDGSNDTHTPSPPHVDGISSPINSPPTSGSQTPTPPHVDGVSF